MFQLTAQQLDAIDAAGMKILAEIGVRVDDDDLRNKAIQAGATPGTRTADTICLPTEMVRHAIAQAPGTATIADAAGRKTLIGPGQAPTFWTGAALNIVEGETSRAIDRQAFTDFVRIADAMEQVTAVTGTSLDDVPPPGRDVAGMRIMAENTNKHFRPLLFTAAGIEPILDIAQVVTGDTILRDHPLVSFGYSCLSPLHWPKITSDLWRLSGGHGLPVMLNGEPVAGASSPVTLAGSVALSNAEILAGLVLVQLLEPGRPTIYNLGFAHTIDMRSGACLSGNAESALMAYAGAQLARRYDLPCASWMDNDAFCDDDQATMEQTLTGMAHVLGGISVIWGMGQLQTQKAVSALRLVMDDVLAGSLKRLWRGFDVNEDTLALDVIAQVVHAGGGDFLSHGHTLDHFRSELSESPLLMRTDRDRWQGDGATTLAWRAQAKINELKVADAKTYLSDQQARDIAAIEKRHLERVG